MLRLAANELKLNALFLFTVFVTSCIVYLFLARIRLFTGYGMGGIQLGVGFSSVMVLGLLLREESSKAQTIYRSLPLDQASVVSAKLFVIILLLIANVAFGYSLQVINAYVGPWVPHQFRRWSIQHLFGQIEAGYALEHSLIARAIVMTIIVSLALPLIIRFGSVSRLLICYLVIILVWGLGVNQFLRVSLYSAFFLGLSRWIFLVSVLMLIALAVSWRISVWLYGRREW
ncbi:MAG TPA: ABC-2 transporter permease [Bacteroidota bacterium]|nr:ABC-2 transporter permease [Bacteroidota bacterium]